MITTTRHMCLSSRGSSNFFFKTTLIISHFLTFNCMWSNSKRSSFWPVYKCVHRGVHSIWQKPRERDPPPADYMDRSCSPNEITFFWYDFYRKEEKTPTELRALFDLWEPFQRPLLIKRPFFWLLQLYSPARYERKKKRVLIDPTDLN